MMALPLKAIDGQQQARRQVWRTACNRHQKPTA
jgi:hypothetical protein